MRPSDLEERYLRDIEVRHPQTVYREMRDIKDWGKEVCVVFCLDSRNRIISREIVSIGTLNANIIHPREVFRTAITRNANAIIICHNHPSGGLEPSDEDTKMTKRLSDAGDILNIKMLDHLIVTRDGYFSFQEEGKL